jgi:hypothetical protein
MKMSVVPILPSDCEVDLKENRMSSVIVPGTSNMPVNSTLAESVECVRVVVMRKVRHFEVKKMRVVPIVVILSERLNR